MINDIHEKLGSSFHSMEYFELLTRENNKINAKRKTIAPVLEKASVNICCRVSLTKANENSSFAYLKLMCLIFL